MEEVQRALIMVVRRTAIPRAHDRLITKAGLEIDRVEAVALSRIADGGSMRVTELAEQLGVACSTAGRHGANLERTGLVARHQDPVDRRVTVLTPTPDGVDLIGHLRYVRRCLLDEVLTDWSTDDLQSLARLLDRLGKDLFYLSEPTMAEG